MVQTFRTPVTLGTVKRETLNYELTVPIFDAPGWGRHMEDNLDTIDALIFAATGALALEGVWENSTAYSVGDRVVDNTTGTIYRCEVAHTSSPTDTFAVERANNPTYWAITNVGWDMRGAWTTTTDYMEGDVVYDLAEHVVAVCNNPHTSTTDIRTDAANWDFLVDLKQTVVDAEDAATTATIQAGIATSQAGIATTKAGEAFASASNAADSENAAFSYAESAGIDALQTANDRLQTAADVISATSAKQDAEQARDTAEQYLDQLTDLYLGSLEEDPTTDLDGDPLQDGAFYWNSSFQNLRFYNLGEEEWVNGPSSTVNADDVVFNPVPSGMTATHVQGAIDELVGMIGSGGVADGDYGDITVSGDGAAWTINAGAVELSMLETAVQNLLTLASTAIQPSDLAAVATSGDYDDLSNTPTLGTAASEDVSAFATAAQGAKADTAVQPSSLGNSASLDVGTTAGTVAAGNDSRFHDQVTLVGTPNYLSISGQEITRWPIDLAAHVTGTLPAGNLPDASTSAKGVVELATAAEFIAGTDSTRALVTSEIWSAATYTALTDAATIALNFNSFLTLAQCTLAGNRTLGNPTNERVGQQFILKFTATGATRTLTLHSDFKLAQGVEAGPYSITTSQTLYICGFVDAASNLIVTGVVRL